MQASDQGAARQVGQVETKRRSRGQTRDSRVLVAREDTLLPRLFLNCRAFHSLTKRIQGNHSLSLFPDQPIREADTATLTVRAVVKAVFAVELKRGGRIDRKVCSSVNLCISQE